MTGDHHGQTPTRATLQVAATEEILGTHRPWQDAGQVTVATAEWVSWYNEDRIHSACGNIPPTEYENAWLTRNGHTIIMPEAKAS
jgi:transposase InsO family protein